MPIDPTHITRLLYRVIRGQALSAEEETTLEAWASESEYNREVVEAARNEDRFNQGLEQRLSENYELAWQKLRARIGIPVQPVHRVHLLKTAWLRYAAAAIIILGIGTFLWNTQNKKEKPPVATTENPHPVQNDVEPGGNKATLTLADGKKIVLDDAANGQVAKERGASIIKEQNGQIIYRKETGAAATTVALNTMSTPRGGQYQLILPDGSRVWLNAASSITYPTAFTGTTREVIMTGEAYFEVAKDKNRPFRVQVYDAATIEVLGTHFNVNAYAEESAVRATLLEGKIKIMGAETSMILSPGQQAVAASRLTLNPAPDLRHVMAWKNGAFDFNDQDFAASMRQLERWYDITVVYDGAMPKENLGGRIDRGLTVQQVLRGLSGVVAKFRLQGRTLHVLK